MNSIVRLCFCIIVALLLFTVLPAAGTQGDGDSNNPSISTDGRYVTFYSAAANLVAGDTNGMFDIFMRDRQTGTTTLVSRDSTGVEGDGDSQYPSISADGRYVAFQSYATNLVAGDTNGKTDIFVRDRQTGTTTRVSKK
jgi:Tol biopolymer transport system component